MGMGYVACTAVVIAEKQLRSFLPEEYAAFEATVKECKDQVGFDLNFFAQLFRFGHDENSFIVACDQPDIKENADQVELLQKKFFAAYDRLGQAFHEKTTVDGAGLVVHLSFHSTESEGDRYDDVDGRFWVVDGFFQKTPAAKMFEKQLGLQEVFYVSFG